MKETITNTNIGKTYTIEEAPIEELKAVYESVCDEYRRRLCDMWGFDFENSYWIPDNRIGEVVAICDGEYTFGMEDLRYFVENNTSFEDFSEWWRYNLVNPKRQINAYSWFKGLRPEMLKDDGTDIHED